MDIGRRIVYFREKHGWTTNRLANECGLSQSFLRSVELNEKGISVENLRLICETLNISLKTFFDIPPQGDGIDHVLSQQISKLSLEQKQALHAFLEQIT